MATHEIRRRTLRATTPVAVGIALLLGMAPVQAAVAGPPTVSEPDRSRPPADTGADAEPVTRSGQQALSAAELARTLETVTALGAMPEALARPPGRWGRPLRARFWVSARYGIKGKWLAGHHTGIDLAVRTGTRVSAVGPGRVVLARYSGAYGNAVTVRMVDGRYTLFAHLSRISARVGQRVRAGTLLGRSGATGRATGPHLHFEVRAKRGYGTDINPVRYLARRGVRL